MLNFLKLSAMFMVLLFAACKKQELVDPSIIVDIDDEFLIELREELDPNKQQFYLDVETIAMENCENFDIKYSQQKSERLIKVSLDEIKAPTDCEEGEAPARANINLGELPIGFFNININLQNTILNEGRLTVDKNYYLLEMESSNGFALRRTRLERIVEQDFWGYAAYKDSTSTKEIRADFFRELEEISSTKKAEANYYGYFQTDDAGAVELLKNQPELPNYDSFYKRLTVDTDILRAFINRYNRAAVGEELIFKVFTWQGEEI